MEQLIPILVGEDAPRILSQLSELKITFPGNLQVIQDDFDALQRIEDRNLMSGSKIEQARGRVIRRMTHTLGIRCVLRYMKA